MYPNPQSSSDNSQKKMVGEILQQAGLISPAQLKIALEDQNEFFKLKIGEILVLRGWLKQETIDFLVENFLENKIINYQEKYPIGEYLKQAGLLTEEQINNVLKDQKKIGIKFCHLAVMKGFLNQQTADFFLENISKKLTVKQDQTMILNDHDTLNDSVIENLMSDYTLYELVKEEENIIKKKNSKDKSLSTIFFKNDPEIEYSPIWIDV